MFNSDSMESIFIINYTDTACPRSLDPFYLLNTIGQNWTYINKKREKPGHVADAKIELQNSMKP